MGAAHVFDEFVDTRFAGGFIAQLCERFAATAFPFRQIELPGRLLQDNGTAHHAELDLRFRSQAELVAEVLRDRHLSAFYDPHTQEYGDRIPIASRAGCPLSARGTAAVPARARSARAAGKPGLYPENPCGNGRPGSLRATARRRRSASPPDAYCAVRQPPATANRLVSIPRLPVAGARTPDLPGPVQFRSIPS